LKVKFLGKVANFKDQLYDIEQKDSNPDSKSRT